MGESPNNFIPYKTLRRLNILIFSLMLVSNFHSILYSSLNPTTLFQGNMLRVSQKNNAVPCLCVLMHMFVLSWLLLLFFLGSSYLSSFHPLAQIYTLFSDCMYINFCLIINTDNLIELFHQISLSLDYKLFVGRGLIFVSVLKLRNFA